MTATVLDATGTAVGTATVNGTFSHHKGTLTCVTTASGTCTLGDFSLRRSTMSTVFTVTNVAPGGCQLIGSRSGRAYS